MKCPFCGFDDTIITNSRPLDSAMVVRRRRECTNCNKRFTTYERLEDLPLMVSKSNNSRVPFNREKLREGILKACEKRPIPLHTIERIVSEVENELQEYVLGVSSRVIGEKVLKKLQETDPVAYIRFASVYYQYADIDTFITELQKLKEQQQKNQAKDKSNEERGNDFNDRTKQK